MRSALATLVFLAACSRGTSPDLDAAPGDRRDAPEVAVDAPALPGDDLAPVRHTIVVDGIDDFFASEQFATTSNGYDARVTWDETHLYLGYGGPDLDPAALDAASKWLFVAIDVDPGAATGAAQSLAYNTQHAVFPAGFGAELYARYKCDGSFATLEQFAAPDWMTSATAPQVARSGSFVELAIPRAVFGTATTVGVVTWMINEKPDFEGTFAGLYAGNFTDGYQPALALTKYLRADFTSPRAPNDPLNQAP
ncbi:MAG: hypothetical protein KIT31_27425 [Deltaproteobacteria bacterium]|nr:hypothetical protein [Deltaproteobacteria bacterium]